MIERLLLDMADNLPLGNNTLSDKDKEYAERFYGYICAGADKSRALGYYAYRADSGDFVAHYIAGLCYLAFDFASARKCFESICDKSDSQSTFRHIDGSEIQIDAKDLQKIKARCYRHIGAMYSDGLSVEQSYKKAVELFQKGADLGDSVAFYNLGVMYSKGRGVEQNYKKAAELFQKACDLGVAWAFNNLGYMYKYGQGVEQNYNKAVELYQKACDLGFAVAFNNLGRMYDEGQGVNVDKQKALQLYKKACDMGNNAGCENYRNLRDELGV